MRRHLSYANVVATLALVFAMSGGALAASHYLIKSTSQISPKVLKKLAGRTGKRGAIGPTGATGPALGATPGQSGAAASAGPRGAEGKQGREGPPGRDGRQGKEGPSGPTGASASESIAESFVQVGPPSSPIPIEGTGENVIVLSTHQSTGEGEDLYLKGRSRVLVQATLQIQAEAAPAQ